MCAAAGSFHRELGYNMKFDFETIADSIDFGFGTDFREDYTMMAGAQLHVKTAPCIVDALIRLSQAGLYGWTRSDDAQYLDAIENWMRTIRGWNIRREWIVPSYGILQGISACIRAFTQPGDGIIVQQPVYLLYARTIANCGRVLVDNTLRLTDGRYSMDFSDLEAKMRDPHNKLMILCNPHNPIMDVWDQQALGEVARLAKQNGVLVVADEIFAEHVTLPEGITPYGSIKDARDNCVICTSLGKAFNFTGTSHSNVIIPNESIRRRYVAQRDSDHYGSLSPFMRIATLAAYTAQGKEWIDALMAFTAENERLLRMFLAEHLPKAYLCRHNAGTLVWVDFRAEGTEEEMQELFIAAGIEPDLGSKYGEPGRGFMRLQIGMPRRELTGALERLAAVIHKK